MTEHFDSVKSMINNLRSEDPEERLTSMRGIHLIASTLGPERTRDELLPYLTDYLDENEVVLRVFANALGTMLQEVGGADHLQSILTPLELLSSLDEITVRDEAVTSLQTIGGQVFRETGEAAAQAQRDFLDLVHRLGKATTQCRSSASYLIATAYPHVSTAIKGQLMSLFIELCNDKEIMVRRAACISLGKHMVHVLGNRSTELINALTAFSQDKFDAVRLQTVEAAAALLKALPYELHANVFSSIKALMSDYSWRVRHMAADRLGKLAEAMSPAEVKNILPFFRSLSQDAEAEIRASAVFSMASLLAVFRDPSAKRELLTAGCRLVNDENAHVRMCLASAVLRSVAHVAKELWATTIVPTCTQLLKDQEADVRLALVSGFSSMGNTPEAREMAPKLVPVVVALAGDPNWRIREVVISQVPFLITSLGKNAEDVVELCVQHLVDRVATIREAAVRSCCTLVAENGTAWSRASLFPRLSSMASTNNYLHRVALAHFYASLASVQSLDCGTASQHILPMLRLFAQDSVPNVRLNCAKALLALKKGRRLSDSDTEPLISRLRKDADVDVRFVASED
ncbi:putative serine/threonine protein phosphatase 2A regulatory subunit [Trypanosoma cruzi]|uniref:Serine/threonine protein phosphatase 2A regulatory subunit, putative n=2 Tax=Trypanosoma cruzi TaxID=5693 RepID=Q4DIA8_TRYCC|nr:serine/threonine protein phosphatase 2A regulatory subunit, putative [Trypanosoma cruzi]EAN92263.1 serine/threonine protein phosphatase 2A regulatory subunit, putative [Trypanosoma cruzi]PWV08717.1 putative serine/threonine protein phosphatase 2A regulatory subunit [Trypanosoma cruzi]RNC48519.1 putative serine/threonine protein phosphatase 2A regulatory subunit [Trypanosoma cruzi]|eukprot:XP_814114.1 serine/threonine protein phosphatase 2A regulatory subunit [Trypanosoma cruzi strain CL Brener]